MQEKIEHRIGVAAPASIVWEIISDLAAWPDWNPIYPKAAGRIGFGEKLALTLALPDRPHREIAPVVFDWAPEEAIHWRAKHFGGLAWSVRFLEIEAMSETGCIFSNGEIFGGMLAPEALKPIRRALRLGFASLGEAVKERAESLWRERGGGAT
jgi:hypothetical protein